MTIQEFRDYMASGKPVVGGGDVHMMFHKLSQEALQITAEINGKYHTPEQLHDLLEQLWGREVPKTVGMFPPFHTDCGKNTVVGERVFINMGCKFQGRKKLQGKIRKKKNHQKEKDITGSVKRANHNKGSMIVSDPTELVQPGGNNHSSRFVRLCVGACFIHGAG